MNIYNKTEKFVKDSFGKRKIRHLERTVFWLKKLMPEAHEALQVAAISHDIERAFRKDGIASVRNREKGFLDEEHLEFHQKESARIICEFLTREGADESLIKRVGELVEKHEVGGDRDQNMLKDADSISFFENNAEHFIKGKATELGREKVKEKFDWMFNRITSEEAKEMSRFWYIEALEKLGY